MERRGSSSAKDALNCFNVARRSSPLPAPFAFFGICTAALFIAFRVGTLDWVGSFSYRLRSFSSPLNECFSFLPVGE